MLLCAAPKEYGQAFAAKPGKTLGCNYFSGFVCFSLALKIASQFRRATLSLQYPVCENLLCPGPPHRLAGFPRFFSEALLRTVIISFFCRKSY